MIKAPAIAVTLAAMLALSACAPKEKDKAEIPPPPAAGAPLVQVKALADIKDPPPPYDDKASPEQVTAMIDAAYERAKANGKRVVVDLGGNWCVWCRGLAGALHRPEVAPYIEQHFEVVYVPVSTKQGATDMNRQVLERFNLKEDPGGYPWMIVTDPNGEVLVSSMEITDQDHGYATPQAWVNWLARYAKTPTTTETKA